jgi:hypothetical protein
LAAPSTVDRIEAEIERRVAERLRELGVGE